MLIEKRAIGRVRPALALSTLLLPMLSACGDDSAATTPNRPPVFSSAATVSIVENTTGAVYQASATDPDGDALTYSISGGADAARFTITSAGQLSFVTPPNYDLPTDADRDNVYLVQINVSDGKTSSSLALAVTVTNSKENIAVHRVATGFTNPTAIAPVSDTAVLVAEKAGAIYLLNPQTGVKTLLVQIANIGTVGVTALAAAPTFASDGTFFVMYTTQTGYLVINRFLRNPAGSTVPDGYGPIVWANAPQYAGGGWLGYDGTGNLLAATGDAGGSGDPTGSAQDDTSWLGKVLLIAPNPDPYAGASPVFFIVSRIAKGLHQPNGGSLFYNGVLLADHGQDVAEELDFFVPGATVSNFGWPFKEGTRTVNGTPPAGLIDPLLEYFRSGGLRTGQAIIGGSIGPPGIGRGPSALAPLANQYVFGDGSGAIFTVPVPSLVAGTTLQSDTIERRDADFAPDQGTMNHPVAITPSSNRTLYILDGGGDLFRVDIVN